MLKGFFVSRIWSAASSKPLSMGFVIDLSLRKIGATMPDRADCVVHQRFCRSTNVQVVSGLARV